MGFIRLRRLVSGAIALEIQEHTKDLEAHRNQTCAGVLAFEHQVIVGQFPSDAADRRRTI